MWLAVSSRWLCWEVYRSGWDEQGRGRRHDALLVGHRHWGCVGPQSICAGVSWKADRAAISSLLLFALCSIILTSMIAFFCNVHVGRGLLL